MNIKSLIISLTSLLLFICMSSSVFAQQNDFDKELLSDIDILETVLDRLIDTNQSTVRFFGSGARGFYLMNYGVIFSVNHSYIPQKSVSVSVDHLLRAGNQQHYLVQEKKTVENRADKIEKLKNSLTRFLYAYAPVLSSLGNDENVSVIVDFNSYFSGYANIDDGAPQQIIASASMKDIKNYRKEKINKNEFAKKVSFNEKKSMDEDITILSKVIQTSLHHGNKNASYGLAGIVKGLYFQGYGAIFIVNLDFGTRVWNVFYKNFEKKQEQGVPVINLQNIKEEPIEDDVKEIEQKLIRMISSYGHTLKNVKPDECIEVVLNFNRVVMNDKFSKNILKVKKKDVDDFNKGKIDLNKFKKKVEIIYY